MQKLVITANADAVVQPRVRRKNTQLVEVGTRIRVMQAQLDVLQSSHGALSTELDNLHMKDWHGTIPGRCEDLRTLRRDVNSFLGDLAGYSYFGDNLDNKLCKVLGRLGTLDAALQDDALENVEPRMSLKAHRSERSFKLRKWRDQIRSPSKSLTSSKNSHRHSTSSET